MTTSTAWKPDHAVDPEVVRDHLAKHGVFEAVDDFYDRLERGGLPEADVLSPAEVRAWLKERCGA